MTVSARDADGGWELATGWTCTSCGGGSVEVNNGVSQMDPRFTTGHCVACTPWPRPKKHPFKKGTWIQPPRKSVQLIQSQSFDRPAFERRQEVERNRKLAGRLMGKGAAKLSPVELDEARAAAAWLSREP